jgi:hypothetical protein
VDSSLVSSDSEDENNSDESEDELDEMLVHSQSDDSVEAVKTLKQDRIKSQKDLEDIKRLFAADVSAYVSKTG